MKSELSIRQGMDLMQIYLIKSQTPQVLLGPASGLGQLLPAVKLSAERSLLTLETRQ